MFLTPQRNLVLPHYITPPSSASPRARLPAKLTERLAALIGSSVVAVTRGRYVSVLEPGFGFESRRKMMRGLRVWRSSGLFKSFKPNGISKFYGILGRLQEVVGEEGVGEDRR